MRRLLCLVLVVTACEREKLIGTSGAVEVDTAALDFGTVTLGASSVRQLVVHNTSLTPRAGHVSSPAPFALEQDVTVPGGGSVGVAVTFTPVAAGAARATLSFIADDARAGVALSGSGQVAPVCAGKADGFSCATGNACLSGGTCRGGACLGQAVSCDDANACTTDVCDPASGCAHVAVQCAAPADPCEVARCDPATGCTTAPATDGTQCGASDCTTAHVCLSGRCTVAAVPDGYACTGSNACQGPGTCHAGVCEQPIGQSISEAWRVAAAKPYLFFEGVSDTVGDLYWLECEYNGFGGGGGAFECDLVSYTSGGALRFRVAHSRNATAPVRQLIAAGQLISAGARHVTAASLLTGTVVWETDVPVSPAAPQGMLIAELASDGSWIHGTLLNGSGYAGSFGIGVDGALPWSAGYNGDVDGVVLDATGNSYRNQQAQNQAAMITASTPLDAPQYATANTLGGPVAVNVGQLVTSQGAVLSTADGLEVINPPMGWALLPGLSVLMSAAGRWEAGTSTGPVAQAVDLHGYAAGTGAPTFTTAVSGVVRPTQPVLLADSTVLLASFMAGDTATMLRGIDAQGTQVFACALPGLPPGSGDGALYAGSVALTQGKWAVVHQDQCQGCNLRPAPYVQVFSVPGLIEAPTGWTSERGSASRSGGPH